MQYAILKIMSQLTLQNTRRKDFGMLRIFVDSGSSIKQEEKEQYGVEIFPLHITLGDQEYLDGIDLSMDISYPLPIS